MTYSAADLASAFRRQAGYCADLGSPLWARAMKLIATDAQSGGPFREFLEGWSGDLERGFLPLRLVGGLHYLALAGRAPTLAAELPSTGERPGHNLWPAIVATLAANRDELQRSLEFPPQTNEIGRSLVLLGGFLEVALKSRLPLRLLEIGASAGLNLCWDRFAYQLGPHRWTGRRPALTLSTEWRGAAPPLDAVVAVASRHACDRRPFDLADPDANLRLQGYVWPDQVERLATLRAAMGLAIEMRIQVEKAEALDWIAGRLAESRKGRTTVVYHSVVLQYFAKSERERFVDTLKTAGRESTPECPLAWLAFEQSQRAGEFELQLTIWPGGEHRRLAIAQAHGRWVEWFD